METKSVSGDYGSKKVYAYEKLVTSVTLLVINSLNGNNFSNRPVTTSNIVDMRHLI
jgi:hypothetical protein